MSARSEITRSFPGSAGAIVLALLGGAALLGSAFLLVMGDEEGTSSSVRLEADTAASDQFIAFWEGRANQDSRDFVAFNRLAGGYVQKGRETGDVSYYARAQASVDRSLAVLPGDNYSAYAILATLQNVRHEFAAAETSAERAISLDTSNAGAVAALGDAQLALGKYDEALATYNDLVADAPGLASFSRLAHIQEIRGDLGEAEAAWGNAFSTDGGRNPEATFWARVQYGHFKFGQGDLGGAVGQYDMALEMSPGYIHAVAAQARVAAAEGDHERAADLYGSVVQRYPAPEFVAAYGDVLATMGRSEDAERQFALVGVIADLYRANGIDTDLQMAMYLADHDLDPESAYQQALAVYEKQPDSIYTADALAWAAFRSGRTEEAREYSEKALRLGTSDAALFYHAGMISFALGDEEAARSHLQRGLEVNENFSLTQAPIARETLDSLD